MRPKYQQSKTTVPTLMRCYFHLTNGEETIWDDCGIDVADLVHAHTESIKAIVEVGANNPRLASESAGWTLSVTDRSGALLFNLPLGGGLPS